MGRSRGSRFVKVFLILMVDPPADGTDCVQVAYWTFEAKPARSVGHASKFASQPNYFRQLTAVGHADSRRYLSLVWNHPELDGRITPAATVGLLKNQKSIGAVTVDLFQKVHNARNLIPLQLEQCLQRRCRAKPDRHDRTIES